MEEANGPRRVRAGSIRRGDLEPYTALRWVGTLFKAAAVFLAVAVVAELIAGISAVGFGVLPQLLGQVARAVVLALVLWGGGDLARLLVHVGHDIRTERILLSRIANRLPAVEVVRGGGGVEGESPGAPELGAAD